MVRSIFCKEQWEQFAHSHSFEKSDESESLPYLFKKERHSEERREQLALGPKKGKAVNQEQITSLFGKEWQERFAHSHCFVKSNKSDSLTVPVF